MDNKEMLKVIENSKALDDAGEDGQLYMSKRLTLVELQYLHDYTHEKWASISSYAKEVMTLKAVLVKAELKGK